MSVKETLTRKLGPLPVYGWVIGVGGGLLVAAYIRRLYASAPETDAGDAIDGADDGAGGYVSPSDGTGGAGVSDPNVFPDDHAGGPNTPQPPRNNNDWRKDAIRAGIAFGFGALATQGMIDRYLTGGSLSEKQAERVNRIIAQVGPPPKATPSPSIRHPKPPGKHHNGGDDSPEHHGGRPKTNGEWKERGANAMHKAGYNRVRVTTVLTHYLHGRDLTGTERNIVHAVIARIGPAPRPPRHSGHKHDQHHAATPTTRHDAGANL